MSGRNAFGDLTKGFTPKRRARVEARKAELRAAMPLHELRQARAMTQKAVGEALQVKQPPSPSWKGAPTCMSRTSGPISRPWEGA